MTAYDTAAADLSYLSSQASYGFTPSIPTTQLVNAYNDFVAQVAGFSAADQATMKSAEEWTTLQLHGPTAAAFDPTATQNASASLYHLVGTLNQQPAATAPPSNSGGFSPGGGGTSASGGTSLNNNPAAGAATATPVTSPAAAAVDAAAAAGAAVPSTAITTTNNNTAPTITAHHATPATGVSLGATIFIALGAIFLGGALVFMFQPELIGMKRNPVRKKRKKRMRR